MLRVFLQVTSTNANCESLIAVAMGTWLTCSSLPFPSRPLFLPPLSTSLSLSVCPSLWFHSAGEGSWVTVLSLANNSCGHYGEPYWWVFIYIELTQVFQTTWKFAPSGSTCPPDVQNRVFTSKGARYAARTSRANPKLGRSSSPTMFNILLSNCCPHLGTALAPPQHYAVHCCLCTLCTHYIAACVNCGYSELYQQLLSCPV